MCARIARQQGAETVTGVDLVPERLAMAERHGVTTIDAEAQDDASSVIREMTDGRGPDGEAVRRQVIDSEGVHIGAEPWVAHRTPTRCSRRRSTVQ